MARPSSAQPLTCSGTPERSLRDTAQNHYSIQVGIGRGLIRTFAEQWVVDLTDLTPTVRKVAELVRTGRATSAQRLLPPERVYEVSRDTALRLHMT